MVHSDNGLEQTGIYAVLDDTGIEGRRVILMGVEHWRIDPLNSHGIQVLKLLASMIITELEKEYDELQQQVGLELAGLSMDEVYASEDLSFVIPNVREMHLSRRR